MDFDAAFTELLGHEGTYSNNPSDPGGETMWGITKAVAVENGYNAPMKTMPVDVAKAIYRKNYWAPAKCDELPPLLRYVVFDGAVNSGVKQSARWLQRAVGVDADGVIGLKTLNAVARADANLLYRRILGQRLNLMADLKHWDTFGKGWARRIAALLEA